MLVNLTVHAGFSKKEARKMAPSGLYLGYCCTDMVSIGELQIACFLGEAKHASSRSDTSNKGNKEVHALTVTREWTAEQVKNVLLAHHEGCQGCHEHCLSRHMLHA